MTAMVAVSIAGATSMMTNTWCATRVAAGADWNAGMMADADWTNACFLVGFNAIFQPLTLSINIGHT